MAAFAAGRSIERCTANRVAHRPVPARQTDHDLAIVEQRCKPGDMDYGAG
jgi:hypothetical protein